MIEIPDYNKSHVLIIGDSMLDRYWHGQTSRISPEAPVPIVHVQAEKELPGGAGNVALNVNSLGAHATLVSIVGEDPAGDALVSALDARKVTTRILRDSSRPTVTKLRVVCQQQQLIRLDFENNLGALDVSGLLPLFKQALDNAKVVILSDYHKGTLPDPQPYIQAAKASGIPVLVDPKGSDFFPYRGATLLTPNRKEFERVVGPCFNEEELIEKGLEALIKYDLQSLLITRGEQGMTLLQRDETPLHLSALAREIFDVTGAGDTVIAVLAANLAAGLSLVDATYLSNLAASVAVGKLGASCVSVPELRRQLQIVQGRHSGIVNRQQLRLLVQDAKAFGEKIVMTNGCFDILHAGHVTYLKQAKSLGHRLCVAVNDDASVRALKGETRPINSLEKRMDVLSALESVDWVVPFSEDTPLALIELIQPEVLVKGGDYKLDGVVGRECVESYGGEVRILPYQTGCSTSATIANILATEA